jgi:hypothetical protein
MLRKATLAVARGPRIRTGNLPRLPSSALAALAAIQLALAW